MGGGWKLGLQGLSELLIWDYNNNNNTTAKCTSGYLQGKA